MRNSAHKLNKEDTNSRVSYKDMILDQIISPPFRPPHLKINTNTRLLGQFSGHLDENKSSCRRPSTTLHILYGKIQKYWVQFCAIFYIKCIFNLSLVLIKRKKYYNIILLKISPQFLLNISTFSYTKYVRQLKVWGVMSFHLNALKIGPNVLYWC